MDDTGRLSPERVGRATAEGTLYGREHEVDVLASLVRGLAEGAGGALPEPAAAALLEARAPGLDRAHRDRLLSEAAGNPLALVELPKSVRPGHPASGLTGPLLPLTARLEQAFAAQQSGLPETTRAVLLAAAANDRSALPSASPGWPSGPGSSCGRPGKGAAAANRDRGTS